ANKLIPKGTVFAFTRAIPFHWKRWVLWACRNTIFINSWFAEILSGISRIKSNDRQYAMILKEILIVWDIIEARISSHSINIKVMMTLKEVFHSRYKQFSIPCKFNFFRGCGFRVISIIIKIRLKIAKVHMS